MSSNHSKQFPLLSTILKDDFKLVAQKELSDLENKIKVKTSEKTGKQSYYVNCIIREREIVLRPEEVVRQLYTKKLIEEYGYAKSQIQFEYTVTFGREKKSADIVIFQKNHPTEPYIIIELKKNKLKDGKDQLKSYTNATGAPMAVWTNGLQTHYYHRKDPNYFEPINDIPKATETLEDIINERWTIADLADKDILVKGKKSLKDLILDLEDEVLANAGVDVFEELFKLIFAKLYDEMLGGRDKSYVLQFRNSGQSDFDLKEKLEKLFQNAKNKWNGVFSDDSKITLTPSHLAICVATLQNAKLFNSNLEVVDEAFEYLINKSSKSEKGQYFTPRYVIDMCVKMLNPQPHETMIDTASGSCGFPVHTIFYVWEQILKEKGIEKSHLFTAEEKPVECAEYVQNNVFAIDFDEKAVRVARTLNLIAGDGQTNVLHLNTLDFARWDNQTDQRNWTDNYNDGWRRIRKLQRDQKSYQHFNFDILMANPPFAGDIKEGQLLAQYQLGKNAKGKNQTKVGRDILFIERNINFLKPGGRMAIVLPQGRFNNSSDAHIRNFLAERGRILAVIGLHGNVFKPHTGTKTSVLLWQKWTDENGINPKIDDYSIFFATMQKPSKDNSGEKIYVKTADGTNLLDQHKHLIIDHDLFNHEGLTQDGIYEAFREFAKRENLSFFFRDLVPFDEKRYAELLQSLEVSEVRFSDMNQNGRMDAEYYKKEYFEIERKLKNYELGCDLVKDVFFLNDNLLNQINEKQKYSYVDIGGINTSSGEITSQEIDGYDLPSRAKYILKKGDILVSTVRPNRGAIAISNTDHFIGSSGFAVLNKQESQQNSTNSEILFVFLRTKLINKLLIKYTTGTSYPAITNEDVLNLLFPKFSISLQEKIANIVFQIDQYLDQAKNLYSQAEKLLLQELNLENYTPTPKNTAEISISEMLKVGRMDAEYFQPKYAEFVEHLQSYKNGCQTLGELVSLQKSIEVGADEYINEDKKTEESVPFIRVSNISPFEITTEKYISKESYIKLNTEIDGTFSEKKQPQQNEILLSKDATLGIAYHLADEPAQMIVSGGILRLTNRTYQISNETLTLVLNSLIVKQQINQVAGGSIIKHWLPKDIEKTLIPLIPQTLQVEITELVQKSHQLRAESKKLLEHAKRTVEIAIEENEATALAWVKDKLLK